MLLQMGLLRLGFFQTLPSNQLLNLFKNRNLSLIHPDLSIIKLISSDTEGKLV